MSRFLDRIDRWLSAIETLFTAALVLLALAIGTLQVALRYAFNTGYAWSEEAFMLLTITAMLFAGSRAVRDDKHVRVDLLPPLPPALRRALRAAVHAITLALCAYFAYAGARYVVFVRSIGTVSPASGIPDWVIYSVVPITMSMFSIRYVVRIARALRGDDFEIAGRRPARTTAELDRGAS